MTTATAAAVLSPKRALRASLWAVQILLAAAFGMAGVMKATAPLAELAANMPWTAVVPAALVRFIGVAELAAAVGFVLPALTRIKPILTAFAGLGIVAIMAFALVFHLARGEFGALPINLVFAALAGFVAWGRTKAAPIAPR